MATELSVTAKGQITLKPSVLDHLGVRPGQKVEVDRPVAEAGLKILRDGGDFADGCILFEAERSKCERLATFNESLIKLSQGRASPP